MEPRDRHRDEGTEPGEEQRREEQDGGERTRPSVARVVGLVLAAVLTFVVTLLVGVVLLLQTGWGARQAQERLVPVVNGLLQEGVTLHVDRLDGTFVNSLRLYDAALVGAEGDTLVHVDTARLGYNLLGLLRGRLVLDEVTVLDPTVRMEQRADGTWDLVRAFPSDTTQQGGTTVLLDRLLLREGHARLDFYSPRGDSTVVVDDLYARLGGLRTGPTTPLALDLDTLRGRYLLPGARDSARVAAALTLADGALAVRGLTLTSPHSDVRTVGTLRLPADGEPVEDIDFALRASPLALRDLHPFLPALNPEATLTLEADLGGTSQALVVDAEGTTGSGGAFELDGTVSPGAAGPLTYRFRAEVRRLEPGYFTAGPAGTPLLVNADLSADLEGTDLEALTGTVDARLFDTRLGTTRVEQATLDGTFDGGAADLALRADLRGGSVTLDAAGRPFDPTPTYRADGRFTDLRLGRLLDDPQLTSDLAGTFTLDGRGLDPETATVSADLDVDGILNGRTLRRADADLALEQGRLRFDLDLASPGGTLALRGRGTFAGGTVRYQIAEGRFQSLDLAAFTGNPGQTSSLTGTFTAEGRGLSLAEADVDGTLTLAGSRYGSYRIQEALASFDLDRGRLALDADADLEGGSFNARASARLDRATPTYRADGRFQNVQLGELLDNPDQQSDLTGTFSVDGTGFDPQAATLQADLRLVDSSLNGRAVERGTLDLTLRRGGLVFDVDFDTEGGALAARGTATLGPTLRYQIDRGRFDELDLATFTGDTTQTSRLTGTFTARGRGTALPTLTLDAEIDLEPSVYNEQSIRSAAIDLDLARGDLDLTADVVTPDGGFTLAGGGDLLAERPTFALREGTFRNVDLGAWLGRPDLSTALSGRIEAEGAGLDPRQGTLEATVTFEPSRINQARLTDGRVAVLLREGTLDAEGRLDFAEGRAVFDAEAAFAGTTPGDSLLRYDLQAEIDRLDLGALAGLDTVAAGASLTLDVEGRGTDPETMTLQARVRGSEIAYADLDVDRLRLEADVDGGVVRLDTLVLRANFADATAGGTLALWAPQTPSDLHFRADVRRLEPVRPLLGLRQLAVSDGRLEGRVFGTRGTLRVSARGEVTSLVYNDVRVAGFDGRVQATLDSLRQIEQGSVDAEISYFSLPSITVEQTALEARYDSNQVVFRGDLVLDERREGDFAGRLDLRPGRERLELDDLNLQFDGDGWELLQPATVTYGEEYRVSGFLLYSDDQQIAVDGVVDPDGRQNLVVTVEAVEIDPVTDLLGFRGLGGTLTGSVDLTGAAEAPNLDGLLRADLRSFDEPVGTLRLDVDYDSLRLGLDALLTHRDGSTLAADGFVVYDLSLAPGAGPQQTGLRLQTERLPESTLRFTAVADSFAIGWIEPFLDPQTVERVDGRLVGEVQIGGTLDQPDFEGRARLLDGLVELPQLDLAYTDIRAEALFEGDRIELQEARLRSGGGRLTAEGVLRVPSLADAQFDVEARARDFLAIDTREIRAVADADLQVTGAVTQPQIRGDVRVLSADYYIEDSAGGGDLQNVTLTERDVQMLERHFGVRLAEADTTTFDFYEASSIELDVELERDTWVRARSNPELNIQLTGDVDFVKPPDEPEQVFGTIEVIESRSYIKQFGRRFDITSGLLRFNGEATNPVIDAAAAYEVKSTASTEDAQVTITLDITGRVQNPEIELGSDPPMENVDIVSYIATGRPAGQSLNFESGEGGLLGRGESLAISQVAGMVEGLAAENLGLDVVEIQQSGLDDITLTLGKYFTPRLYAAVRQPLANVTQQTDQGLGTEFTLEYELLEWLLTRATQRDNTLRFDLFWEYSY